MEGEVDEAEQLRKQIHYLTDLIANANHKSQKGPQYHVDNHRHVKSNSARTFHSFSKMVPSIQHKPASTVKNPKHTEIRFSKQFSWKRSSSDPDLVSSAKKNAVCTKNQNLCKNSFTKCYNESLKNHKSDSSTLSLPSKDMDNFAAEAKFCLRDQRVSAMQSKHKIVSSHTNETDFVRAKMQKTEQEIAELKKIISERSKKASCAQKNSLGAASVESSAATLSIDSTRNKTCVERRLENSGEQSQNNLSCSKTNNGKQFPNKTIVSDSVCISPSKSVNTACQNHVPEKVSCKTSSLNQQSMSQPVKLDIQDKPTRQKALGNTQNTSRMLMKQEDSIKIEPSNVDIKHSMSNSNSCNLLPKSDNSCPSDKLILNNAESGKSKANSPDTVLVKMSKYKLQRAGTKALANEEQIKNNAGANRLHTFDQSVTNVGYTCSTSSTQEMVYKRSSDQPQFIKKSKYAIVRKENPQAKTSLDAATDGHNLATQFVKLSKYSLKRVESLEQKSSTPGWLKCPPSSAQRVARGLQTKYRIMKMPAYTPGRWKYNRQHSKYREQYPHPTFCQPFMKHKAKRNWDMGYRPYTRFGFKYNTGNFHTFHSYWLQKSWLVQTQYPKKVVHKQKRLNLLKKNIPFDPSLRLDRRRPLRSRSKGSMLSGTPHRSTVARLHKAGIQSKYQVDNRSSSSKSKALSPRTRRLINKTVARVGSKYRKVNKQPRKYCMYFNRFGKCNRNEKCPYIHDPEKVAVCTRFLRGTCKIKGCRFSHKISKEKMPVCSYFLKGICSRDECPYSHVNVSRDAEICEEFVNGYCKEGEKCKKKHVLECPSFHSTGQCTKGPACKLQHRQASKRQQPPDSLMKVIKVEPGTSHEGETFTSIVSAPGISESNVLQPFNHETKLPAYISLKLMRPDPPGPVVVIDDDDSSNTGLRIRPLL
ncbi:uncharacterized protein LOC127845667 isoform X2 [Dreissena polymorpha]|uniref:uncharacterized protein LOC127845667 isoform X2 n=1 Tax=Dreissena polymorpha TaxID=45954 RepID=UPI00226429A2|nr:uncharacterized protein LOC127845667 isoform X2 [Dreissena polymorpha]